MARIESLLRTLPYYYARDKSEFNVDNIVSAREWFRGVALELDRIDSIIDDIRKSRSIEEAFDFGLDMVASRVGVSRRDGETDDELRERVKFEIFVQESHGNIPQIKEIVGRFLTNESGFIRTPEDEVSQNAQDPTDISVDTAESNGDSHGDTRDVQTKDIYLWENEMPWLGLTTGADHPQYGNFRMFVEVDVPHTAVPEQTNANFKFYTDDSISDPEAVTDDDWIRLHGWQEEPDDNYGLWGLPDSQPDLSGVLDQIDRSRAAGVESLLWGMFGFTFYHDDTISDPETVTDRHHGWTALWDGPYRELQTAIENNAADVIQ